MKGEKRIFVFLCALSGMSCIVILMAILSPLFSKLTAPTLLNIQVAPSTAIVTINGEDYKTGIQEGFKPGTYTAKIHQDGFSEKEVEFTIKDHQTTDLRDYIINDDEGMTYFERSEADLSVMRIIANTDVQAGQFISSYDKKLQIKENLPILKYYGAESSMSQSQSMARLGKMTIADGTGNPLCERVFCLIVSGSHANDSNARTELSELGYDYEEYEVVYAKD